MIRARGFTLIEIMMVVAILGLTLTMGIPSFMRTIKREGMGKVERDMMQACQEARRSAILNNRITDLVIRPLDHTFGCRASLGRWKFPMTLLLTLWGSISSRWKKPRRRTCHFNPNGTSDEFTIVLHGPDGSYRKISLDTSRRCPTWRRSNEDATYLAQAPARAFTLIEVMVAIAIFFMAMFAILGVLSSGVHAATILRTSGPTAGMVAGQYYATNEIGRGFGFRGFQRHCGLWRLRVASRKTGSGYERFIQGGYCGDQTRTAIKARS